LQDPPKFTQIGIFGLKTNYLATLVLTLSLLKKQSLNLLAVRVMAFSHKTSKIGNFGLLNILR
jgi:hypothetical protein